jgi:hypothetical protein
MSVHYKFKSALEYDTVTFDGLHISVRDLKKAILHQKRIGKNTDFDLQVTNAQTKEGKDTYFYGVFVKYQQLENDERSYNSVKRNRNV